MTNIYQVQAYHLIMCRYFCIGFINFLLKGKRLLDYTNLFSSEEHEKNDKMKSDEKITLRYLWQV